MPCIGLAAVLISIAPMIGWQTGGSIERVGVLCAVALITAIRCPETNAEIASGGRQFDPDQLRQSYQQLSVKFGSQSADRRNSDLPLQNRSASRRLHIAPHSVFEPARFVVVLCILTPQWLHDLLVPHAERVVVCNTRGKSEMDNKNDRLDADGLSERLRLGALMGLGAFLERNVHPPTQTTHHSHDRKRLGRHRRPQPDRSALVAYRRHNRCLVNVNAGY